MADRVVPMFRSVPAQLERTGPRRLTGRLVPYNVPAGVADETPDGGFEVYQEGFRRGAFASQVNSREPKAAAARVGLIHRHEGGLGFLGAFSALREEPDGLWGDAWVLTNHAQNVEDLLGMGINELSIEFHLPGSTKREGPNTEVDDSGVRWRTRAYLHQVALEARGAYRDAQVMAYRNAVEEAAEAETAAAEAEAAREAEDEAAAESTAEAEAAAAAVLERRRLWDELVGRFDADVERQDRYITEHGLVKPGGFVRVRFET